MIDKLKPQEYQIWKVLSPIIGNHKGKGKVYPNGIEPKPLHVPPAAVDANLIAIILPW